jgi:hypothetical protein
MVTKGICKGRVHLDLRVLAFVDEQVHAIALNLWYQSCTMAVCRTVDRPEALWLRLSKFSRGWVFHLDQGHKGLVIRCRVVAGEGDMVCWVPVECCNTRHEARLGEEVID